MIGPTELLMLLLLAMIGVAPVVVAVVIVIRIARATGGRDERVDKALGLAHVSSQGAEQRREQAHGLPPVAGLRRRLSAFLIDALILFTCGELAAFALRDPLAQLGPNGRLAGLVVILAYFGILNSSLARGQTLGKRVVRIAVRAASGAPISPMRSLLRITLLAIPFFLIDLLGWWAPPLVTGLVSAIGFGVSGAIFYTMVFNRQTRQGFHDLLCGSYVVQVGPSPRATSPTTPLLHSRVAWGLVGVAGLASLAVGSFGSTIAPSGSLGSLEQRLATNSDYFSVSVMEGSVFVVGKPKPERTLAVEGWHKGPIGEAAFKVKSVQLACDTLTLYPEAMSFDQVQVNIKSGVDLGLGSYYLPIHGRSQRPQDWRANCPTAGL